MDDLPDEGSSLEVLGSLSTSAYLKGKKNSHLNEKGSIPTVPVTYFLSTLSPWSLAVERLGLA